MERKKEAASKRIKALLNLGNALTKAGKALTKPIRDLIKLGKATLSRSFGQADQSFISLHMKSLQFQFTTNTGFRLFFRRNHAFPATDNCPEGDDGPRYPIGANSLDYMPKISHTFVLVRRYLP